MHTKDRAPAPVFRLEQHEEVVRWRHLRLLLARGHGHVVHRSLARSAPADVLPPRARVLQTLQQDSGRETLAELDRALVTVDSGHGWCSLVVSARRESVAVRLADEVAARVPAPVDDEDGPLAVWFSDRDGGLRSTSLDLRRWDGARAHYAPDVRRALDALVAHRPDVDTSRRLLLWHGAPGTGKTSAVRSLMQAWRAWAQPVVVTDPEALLSDGRYLRRLLLDVADDLSEPGQEPWRLLVLEDAEALLRKDTGGPAMSKLLNLTDGLLGQGLRCLFLITTNEPLAAVHPAILRPGRCLASVEFVPLPAAQASALVGRPVHGPMTLAEALSARPLETADSTPAAVGQYL